MSQKKTNQQNLEQEVLKLLEDGQTFMAYNLAREGIAKHPKSLKLQQYCALTLLKTGAVKEAKEIIQSTLEIIYDETINRETLESSNPLTIQPSESIDAEVIELIASIFKEAWQHSRTSGDLMRSRELYLFHFDQENSLSSGTNAASLSWLLGEDKAAKKIADKVIELSAKTKGAMTNITALMALAECHLILKDNDMASAMLNKLQNLSTANHAPIVKMLHQLKLLSDAGFQVPYNMFEILHPPTIVVFAGQTIDRPDAADKRFMIELEPDVRTKIREQLDEIDAKIGYSSAACGSDILFIEEMLDRGSEVHIVLPFEVEDFIAYNVRYAGPRWEARFHKAIDNATSVNLATEEKYLGHDMLYRFANMVLHGVAEMRGNFLLSPPHLIAVWDSNPDSLAGGATDFIDHWADIRTLHIIDLDDIKTAYLEENQLASMPSHLKTIRKIQPQIGLEELQKTPRIIKTMLFADLSGFSKLKEEHIPGFLNFLAELKKTMEEITKKPTSINTWGDAIFAVMENASELAEYALQLSKLVPEISKNTRGLPPISIRTSLHAGPVYEATDPFRKQTNFYGGHINRAARLEPVTVVGEVYATEQFMALLIAEQSSDRVEKTQKGEPYVERFTCDYVGVMALAKGFGEQPVYHLRWF